MYRREIVKGIKKMILGLLVGVALLAWTLADTPVVAQIDSNDAQAHFDPELAYENVE